MADDARDILMKLETTEGKYVDAECGAIIEQGSMGEPTDPLAKGFDAQSLRGRSKVNYFSIDDFTFPVGLIDADDEETPEKRNQRQLHETVSQMAQSMGASAGGKGFAPKQSVEFTRFMQQGKSSRAYPADLEQMSVTKKMDVSSTFIFKLCRDSTTLYGATILKRKAIGDQSLRGYLRIDFKDVLITDLNWDNDEVVKEDFKFVCRQATVTYCMEAFSTEGSSAGLVKLIKMPPTTWSVLKNK